MNTDKYMMATAEYYNKVYGGWLGRVAGSHFGAPLEFRPARYAHGPTRPSPNPSDLGRVAACTQSVAMGEGRGRSDRKELTDYLHPVDPAAVNDDEIYQVAALLALEAHGAGLTAKDIGEEWRKRLYRQQFTAEKVALQNLHRGIPAPECASFKKGNFWFDAIGAQMKADLWGLLTPLSPTLAADYARIDGSVAHQGTGIDGEVFVAALVSLAFGGGDMLAMIQQALEQLLPESEYRRYIEGVLQIQQRHPKPEQWREARGEALGEWNRIRRRLVRETRSIRRKTWLTVIPGLHVLPNAAIIVLSLIYAQSAEDPFGRALCLGGMMGLDTDCNCGNIGTVMGVRLGADGIPSKWISPLQDTFRTYVRDYEEWKIPELARRICAAGENLLKEKSVVTTS